MKKVINVLSLIAATVSILIIIATFLTSYRFLYINGIFSGYYPLQISLTVTMIIWGCKLWQNNIGIRKYIYTIICLILSLASLFFISNLVR